MFATFGAQCYIVIPFVNFYYYGFPLITLFTLQLLAYTQTVFKDAGVVKKSPNISFLKLNWYFQPRFICPTCRVLKPKHSLHCFFCKKCVDR